MLKKSNQIVSLLSRNLMKISVYEGISPALLATMSLSQGVKGNTNEELIESLVKGNIIHNSKLSNTLKKIDRKLFIPHLGSHKSYYENKPYKIAGGQTMTDIFTHAVLLEDCCSKIENILEQKANDGKNKLRVLDVGTGHGYLAYAISAYLTQHHKERAEFEVVGIDSNEKAIEFCNSIKNDVFGSGEGAESLVFSEESLEERMNKPELFDMIVGGFYMPPSLHSILINKLKISSKTKKSDTLGVWPTDSSTGQSLYSYFYNFKNDKLTEHEIMSTMFSMPTVKSSVSKYFVEEGEEECKEHDHVNEEELREKLKNMKIQSKKEEKDALQNLLKDLIIKHSKILNRKITLEEMKQTPEISLVLNKLNKK